MGCTQPVGRAVPNELKEYPELNYVMLAFPGEREVPLFRHKALVLRHRLWIHEVMATAEQPAAVWTAYSQPPTVSLLP
jgi:hypothetical protein